MSCDLPPLGARLDRLRFAADPLFGKVTGGERMNHLMTALAFVASAAALPASSATVLELDFGDARVNATIGATADLSLKLWDSSKGNRYTVAYNPGNAFDWTLGFFDIDGSPNTFDVVILRSPGS
jgi:hypothetical protein